MADRKTPGCRTRPSHEVKQHRGPRRDLADPGAAGLRGRQRSRPRPHPPADRPSHQELRRSTDLLQKAKVRNRRLARQLPRRSASSTRSRAPARSARPAAPSGSVRAARSRLRPMTGPGSCWRSRPTTARPSSPRTLDSAMRIDTGAAELDVMVLDDASPGAGVQRPARGDVRSSAGSATTARPATSASRATSRSACSPRSSRATTTSSSATAT